MLLHLPILSFGVSNLHACLLRKVSINFMKMFFWYCFIVTFRPFLCQELIVLCGVR